MASSVPEDLDKTTASSGTAMNGNLANSDDASPTDGGSSSSPFDLSSISDLLNDPSVKELAMQIAKDPAFRRMAMELKDNFQCTGQEDNLTADAPTYLTNMQKVMDDPQFINMAGRLGNTLMQDPATASILQDLRTSGQRDAKMPEELQLKATLDDIERGGPAMMMKYLEDPVLLGQLADVVGVRIPKELSLSGNRDNASHDDTVYEDYSGRPLLQAASIGDLESLRSLLSGDDACAETDGTGRTALHLACRYGQVVSAKILLEARITVDSLDKHKNTALHYAARYGTQECAKLLLRYGASVTIQNLDGKTPSEVAKTNNHIEIANLLHAGAFL